MIDNNTDEKSASLKRNRDETSIESNELGNTRNEAVHKKTKVENSNGNEQQLGKKASINSEEQKSASDNSKKSTEEHSEDTITKEEKKEDDTEKEITKKDDKAGDKNEKEDIQKNNKVDADNKDSETKQKYVFGSTSKFGAGFNLSNTASSIGSEDTSTELAQKSFSFGSGFAFGGGFDVLKEPKDNISSKTEKSSTLDEEKKSEVSNSKADNTDETVSGSQDNSIVSLKKQEVKSGEEEEEVIYQANAKLYQLQDVKEGWKERGVGHIRINKNRTSGKYRIIMRSRALLKVLLNISLIKGLSVSKGFPGSLQGEKFIRIITFTDNKTPMQYALKTGKKEIAEELYDKIQESKEKL
ncbi:hypothetical protein TBLA_0C04710 [Henningerozyma blattae CBS 6284]|uniref:RanBD1 domain-containing protein n=1 Tax=Henningerozyma blattae (strain ATCC 34711 / CBS 6284 / DSM 70876 / NBRC 10599 / NRRL Y-10934 / UCD 77-7) TaxID=1071380 RepID=I2H1L5_HENB6|nr:hypothetical protein TBLA_0C04710 [Tetrapisispora blattae CBS 6284]CCH60267.1 hypothetical protein TBLA_0C04710 [Tetrapisispora blattae CBS 6284]